jgi:hypothetical protein
VVLSAYFQPHEADEIRAAQLAWWCDELQDWTREQVVWGLRQWNRENPDKRPTPGHILAALKKARGKKHAARVASVAPRPGAPRETLTEDERAERRRQIAEVQTSLAAKMEAGA